MCPDENTLVRFASGGGADAAVEAHVDTCDDCRRVVAAAASEVTLSSPAEPEPPPLAQGAPLGRYRVLRQVGAGGMGAVYAAIDPALERQVAIKVLKARGGSDARLVREARAMAKLSHPNLLPIFELGETGGRAFIAMELVDGQSLDAWRKTASPEQVRAALLEAGKGLAAAHAAGVVHRDFKPANVLVGRDGRVRVTDFGLARDDGGPAAAPGSMFETQAGTVLGTPAYMAPEQLAGRTADARSDQFSFAVAWAESLGGERPYVGKTVAELEQALQRPPRLPRRHRAALARALFIDPAARYPSMDALLKALAPKRRRAWLAAPAAALALAALVLVRGEEEVPVMSAAVDVREGTAMTREMMVERKVPKRLVTTSVVKPADRQYIENQRVQVPVQAGDVLLWSQFETMP